MTISTMNSSNALLVALCCCLCCAAVSRGTAQATAASTDNNFDDKQQQTGPAAIVDAATSATSLGQLVYPNSITISNKQRNAKELKSIAKKNKHKHMSSVVEQQQQEQLLKDGLKKKWHKLVDELIEKELTDSVAGDVAQQRSNTQEQQQQLTASQFMVNTPILRVRQPVASDGQLQFQQQPLKQKLDSASIDADGSENILFLVKRKPALGSSSDGQPLSPVLIAMNNLGNLDTPGQQPRQQQQAARSPLFNIREHANNVLNDRFNVRKDSIITSNNHLGYGQMPKFGSDEQL